MNYLQLTNRLIGECGSGLGTLATLVSPAAGEATRMIDWVADAWNEIQIEQYSWDWARPQITFTTTNQLQRYTPAAIFAAGLNEVTGAPLTGLTLQQWTKKSFRGWRTSIGYPDEQIINFMDWDDFRNIYYYATQHTNYARPVIVSVAPDKSLWFGPIPDQATGPGDSYTIACECWLAPQVLAVDADTPLMPPQYHMAIVYRAMMAYAGYESAPEVFARGKSLYDEMMNKLYVDQLPVMVSGPPLATDPR